MSNDTYNIPMSSILTSSVPDKYNQMRHVTKKEVRPVSHRYRFVLELHLAGYKVKNRLGTETEPDICELTGYKEATVYSILSDPSVVALRQQIMINHDKEFETQYSLVIDAVKTSLDPRQPATVRLQAAKLWGEYHKKFQKVEVNQTLNVTAEDIVVQIMNGSYQPSGQE